MRYLVLLKAVQPSEPPPSGLMEAIMALGQEATTAGALLDTAGLAPSGSAARVRLAGGELSVTDGPFAEAEEFISYAIYQVKSREEAVQWAARFMAIHQERWPGWEGDAEVLRVVGPEDLADPPITA